MEGGGWKCQLYFYGRGDVSEINYQKPPFVNLSAIPQESEICVKFSVFPAVFDISWEESKGCLLKGCLNSTKIPKVGIPESKDSDGENSEKQGFRGQGFPKGKTYAGTLPKTEIPKPGIPKSGILKTGIPKLGDSENGQIQVHSAKIVRAPHRTLQ